MPPAALKESAYGMGMTTWEVCWSIIIPYTRVGLVGGVMLGLGRLHPNKGWADLLDAFASLPASSRGAPLRLLMVGDGPLRKDLEQLSGQLGLAARVHWAGWQHDPAPYYQLADVFVCASVHEPLGNVILVSKSGENAIHGSVYDKYQ